MTSAGDQGDGATAFYEGVLGDSDSPQVRFRYAAPASGAPDAYELVASRLEDPAIGWDGPEGVQAVAQAILTHHTGSEPGQAELEALVMAQGDTWAATPTWRLTVAELDEIV